MSREKKQTKNNSKKRQGTRGRLLLRAHQTQLRIGQFTPTSPSPHHCYDKRKQASKANAHPASRLHTPHPTTTRNRETRSFNDVDDERTGLPGRTRITAIRSTTVIDGIKKVLSTLRGVYVPFRCHKREQGRTEEKKRLRTRAKPPAATTTIRLSHHISYDSTYVGVAMTPPPPH